MDGVLDARLRHSGPRPRTRDHQAELRKFRESTLTLRNRVHDMLVANKTKAEIEKMLRSDFHFADLHIQVSLDGMMAELR